MCSICLDEHRPKMYYSICNHILCDSCLIKCSARSAKFACPICRKMLRRSDFSFKFNEEKLYERDLEIRERVLEVMNKPRVFFGSESEYYDYMEYIEDLVLSIVNGDAEAKAQLDSYKASHQNEIINNAIKSEELRLRRYQDAICEDQQYDETQVAIPDYY